MKWRVKNNHPTFISVQPHHSSVSSQHTLFIFGHSRSSIHIFFTNKRSFLPVCFPSSLESTPAPLRQPRTNLSNSASPISLSGISPISSIDSPLSSSITPSLFHSRLKTFLFYKSFPPQPTFSSPGLTPWIPRTVYRYFWAYPFLLFSLPFFLFSPVCCCSVL